MDEIIEKKILIFNANRYGAKSTHIYYVDYSDGSLLMRDKFKGYCLKEFWLPDQDILSELSDDDFLNVYNIKILKQKGWNKYKILSIDTLDDVNVYNANK